MTNCNCNPIQRTAGTAPATRSAGPTSEWTYRPAVDIVELPGSFQIVADVPGATPQSLDISFEDGLLTINAGVSSRHPENTDFARQEFGVGGFHRRFQVDETIDPEGIAADYQSGVLTVTLPKARHAARRQVPIRTGS
jgi:HSP20 family protein